MIESARIDELVKKEIKQRTDDRSALAKPKEGFLLQKVFSLLGGEDVRTIILYGKANGKDFDLFAILRSDTVFKKKVQGVYDIGMSGGEGFNFFCQMLDPIVTEPLLTGTVVHGDQNLFERAKLLLSVPRDIKKVRWHLVAMAKEIYVSAHRYFMGGDYFHCLENLTFVLSYLEYSKRYWEGVYPMTFSQINYSGSAINNLHIRFKNGECNRYLAEDYLKQIETRVSFAIDNLGK